MGKTSIGRSIASTMGRNFHRISLGGICDQSDIRGHRLVAEVWHLHMHIYTLVCVVLEYFSIDATVLTFRIIHLFSNQTLYTILIPIITCILH